MSFGVFAERLEVEVVEGRGLRFVEGWAKTGYVVNVRSGGGGVP